MDIYFTDIFEVSKQAIEEYGAFNISLLTDLPLFVDPFLLFTSDKPEYQELHDDMIKYLRYLRDASVAGNVPEGLIRTWYRFPEVKQNWLGFCVKANSGRGLGCRFSLALNRNLAEIFRSFGDEQVTKGGHIEKLCLIDKGVGRDMISDFTTNLIKDYLLSYTQTFAQRYIRPQLRVRKAVPKVVFNYQTGVWLPKIFDLPWFEEDCVILTPKDILSKDETWINRRDLLRNFEDVPNAIENNVLRAQINRYFNEMLPKKPKEEDYERAKEATLRQYPQLIDYFIKYKEEHGTEAVERSSTDVQDSQTLYIRQFGELPVLLAQYTEFYRIPGTTAEETRKRIEFFKDVIENKGGHKIFYVNGEPIRKEADVHILFRLVWFATPSDVSREVNDGHGPADFKISRGSSDKTLVEFKLASNTQIHRNLQNQLSVYQKASDAKTAFKVIIYFTDKELMKIQGMMDDLKLWGNPYVILVDARTDNKPSGSKA